MAYRHEAIPIAVVLNAARECRPGKSGLFQAYFYNASGDLLPEIKVRFLSRMIEVDQPPRPLRLSAGENRYVTAHYQAPKDWAETTWNLRWMCSFTGWADRFVGQ